MSKTTDRRHTKGLAAKALCVFLSLLSPCMMGATGQADETDRVLESAETFFKMMRSENFAGTWSLLTSRSKDRIVGDICVETRSSMGDCRREEVRADLRAGGTISSSYWTAFLSSFDPTIILEQSRWEVGRIQPERAELVLTFKRSSNPARLQMFKEGTDWKVGLVETFWTRK